MLGLRKVNKAEYQLTRAMRVWRHRGIDVYQASPDVTANWTSVRDEQNRWHGWVNTRELQAIADIRMAGLALTPGVGKLIIEWLNGAGNIPALPVDELATSALVFGDRDGGPDAEKTAMLKIAMPQFSLWIETLDVELNETRKTTPGQKLKWKIDYVLGSTLASVSTLKSVNAQDILVIQKIEPYALCFNVRLFGWAYPEGTMTSLNEDFNEVNDYTEDNAQEAEKEGHADLEKLPVKIEFIIHSEITTLESLGGLMRNEIVVLPDDVEKSVEIRVNGLRIGKGELVEYNDRIAVEIHEWTGGEDAK